MGVEKQTKGANMGGATMRNTMRLSVIAVAATIVSVVVAAIMLPATALASPSQGDDLTASPAIATQAAKQKVWVITSTTATKTDEYSSDVANSKFTYNKNGLIVKDVENETNTRTAGNWVWKYDKNGNYTNWSVKWKQINGTTWQTTKYDLSFDGKKRVDSIGYNYASYNSKGQCKSYNGTKYSYNSKGFMTKKEYPGAYITKISRNKKGDITKIKTTRTVDNATATDTSTFKITKKSGRIDSWSKTKKNVYQGETSTVETAGKFTWKQISVPKKFVAKVKAQQRWIVDYTLQQSGQAEFPLVLINK